MNAVRRLDIDLNACIGCLACTNACPAALIGFKDEAADRVFTFAETCAQDCIRCAEACSEKAITLSPGEKADQRFLTAKFPLARCAECRMPYATEKMVAKLKETVPTLLVPDGINWLSTCPACRQKKEAANICNKEKKG